MNNTTPTVFDQRWDSLIDIGVYFKEIYTYFRCNGEHSMVTDAIEDIEQEHLINTRNGFKNLMVKLKKANLHREDSVFYTMYTICTTLANFDVTKTKLFAKHVENFFNKASQPIHYIGEITGRKFYRSVFINEPTMRYYFLFFTNYLLFLEAL